MTESLAFAESADRRLQNFLIKRFKREIGETRQLTPDASTREYFRVSWENQTAIACIYPEPFAPAEQSYLDATKLFLAADLPVARIYDFDGDLGVIILEDFGDTVLRQVLEISSLSQRENLIDRSINLIAQIQAATETAFELDSIASRLAFDREKLIWELDFFTKHYFESLRDKPLQSEMAANLKAELSEVASELAARPRVLCHRDFHAANLMIDESFGDLKIIDHQDARMGPASYDLVSLLLDRILEPPSEAWIAEKQRLFLKSRENLQLKSIEFADFTNEFRLQTIQRCLKAIGTFSYQTAVRGKNDYEQYIEPMFAVILQSAESLNRFQSLQKILKKEIKSN